MVEAFHKDPEMRLLTDPLLIVSVPLHPLRRWKRGYNQAGVLAQIVGAKLGLPVENQILKRVRYTQSQTLFKRKDRLKNLRSAFAIRSARYLPLLKNRTILLIDDVLTTGSTLDACAYVLKSAGASTIYTLVVARR